MKRSHLLVIGLAMVILLVGFTLIVDRASGQTVSVDFLPALYVEDYGVGVDHLINNYTMESSANAAGATWQLLGTNNQQNFDLVDSRKDVPFSAGTPKQFNLSNTGSYRNYYLYVVSGFGVSSTLDVHFDYSVASLSPKEEFTPYFNFTMGRSPFITVFDFSKSPTGAIINYTITSSNTFPALQTWYLYGTNTSSFLGSDNAGLFTLLDTQVTIGFTGNVMQIFDISAQPPFKYYIIYVKTGFDTAGTLLEFRFNGQPLIPAPVAAFACAPLSGVHPLSVTCTDASTGTGISSWYWEFGDSNTSTAQNPTHIYDFPGIFDVHERVCNIGGGCDWENKSAYITVSPTAPTFNADFTANETESATAPMTVQFTDTSINVSALIDDWYWEFGTGDVDVVQDPLYIYTLTGTFTVRLRIRNTTFGLEDWENKTGYIKVGLPPTAKIRGDVGESWIRWEWYVNTTPHTPDPNATVDVYLDGTPTPVLLDYMGGYYYLQDLDASEEHRIELLHNATQILLGRSTLRTLPHETTLFLILIMCVVIGILLVISEDPMKVIILGIVGVLLSSYGRSIAYNYYGLGWVFLAFAIGMIAAVVYIMISIMREKLAWH